MEYGVRAIQTYTNMNSVNQTLMSNQVTNMSKRQYRIPYLVYVQGTVTTQSGTGVEGVTVSYCHIDRNTGQKDTTPGFCPVIEFTTNLLGEWSGQILVSNVNWTNTIENFYVSSFYNQTLSNNRFIIHTFQPASQKVAITHLSNQLSTVTDTTTISVFGSVQFDPLNMGGSYFCPFAYVPVIMVQGNGQVINTTSDANGNFTFSVTQSDSVSIYIPFYNGNQWRSTMSVADVTTPDLSVPSNTYSYTATATAIPVVYDFTYSPVTNDGGHWVQVLANANNVITVNAGQAVLNGLFQQFGTGNVKYIVNGKTYNYYKRLTNKATFDFYTNFASQWGNTGNTLDQDFKMYSTYAQMSTNTIKWNYCAYNIANVAYPGYCGPRAAVTNKWSSFTGSNQNKYVSSAEIWIQVFPDAQPYTTDLIQNGNFEESGSNFNHYGTPINWQLSTNTSSSNIATIQTLSNNFPTLQGARLTFESGSYCGTSHVLITKPAGQSSIIGIQQTVHISPGTYIILIYIIPCHD